MQAQEQTPPHFKNTSASIQTVEWLRDWSKWITTVGLSALTGCTLVLQAGVRGLPRPFLLLAIGAFALSVMVSVAVVRGLSILHDSADGTSSVGGCLGRAVIPGVSVRAATRLQLLFLFMGVVFFLSWVILKPAPPMP